MRTPLKALAVLVVGLIAARLAALVIAKQLDDGTEVSDEFRRVVYLNGLDFTSRAGGFRSADVGVTLGGAKIDMRGAVLHPAGASMLIENTLGGVMLQVRDDWAVTVEETIVGGGENDIRVTSPDELPDDAPKLHLQVITRLGGTTITTDNLDS